MGRSPVSSAMMACCASFSAIRNDFCCPCEPYFFNGYPPMRMTMSSRWTPLVVNWFAMSLLRAAASTSPNVAPFSSER